MPAANVNVKQLKLDSCVCVFERDEGLSSGILFSTGGCKRSEARRAIDLMHAAFALPELITWLDKDVVEYDHNGLVESWDRYVHAKPNYRGQDWRHDLCGFQKLLRKCVKESWKMLPKTGTAFLKRRYIEDLDPWEGASTMPRNYMIQVNLPSFSRPHKRSRESIEYL